VAGTSDTTSHEVVPDRLEHDGAWMRQLREDLARAVNHGPLYLRNGLRSEVWRLRLSGDGRLEVAATLRATPSKFTTLADLDADGNLRIAGTLTQNAVLPAPGR
jgi:hypothetical protein